MKTTVVKLSDTECKVLVFSEVGNATMQTTYDQLEDTWMEIDTDEQSYDVNVFLNEDTDQYEAILYKYPSNHFIDDEIDKCVVKFP